MIATNFYKFPEALRFQREMFSNGYHNSPRIMRVMQCTMRSCTQTPAWYKEAKRKSKQLSDQVKIQIISLFAEAKKQLLNIVQFHGKAVNENSKKNPQEQITPHHKAPRLDKRLA